MKIECDRVESVKIMFAKTVEVFNKVVGTFNEEHRLKIKENAIPTIMPNRKVPVAMRQPPEDELQRLVKFKVIAQVDEPTEWVSQSVITFKKNSSVRLGMFRPSRIE